MKLFFKIVSVQNWGCGGFSLTSWLMFVDFFVSILRFFNSSLLIDMIAKRGV